MICKQLEKRAVRLALDSIEEALPCWALARVLDKLVNNRNWSPWLVRKFAA